MSENPKGLNGTPFMPQAALAYAKERKYKLPTKAKKDPALLAEVVEEYVLGEVQDIPKEDRYECTRCGVVVLEPDEFCWFCGADVSDSAAPGQGGAPDHPRFADDEEGESEPESEKADGAAEEDGGAGAETAEEKTESPEEEPEPRPPAPAEYASPTATETNGEKALADYATEIKRESGKTGYSAWLIGRSLFEIEKGDHFREAAHDSMQDFVVDELAMSWKTATEYVRIYRKIDEADARLPGLGFLKLQALAGAPDKDKPRLLKGAMPKSEGGEGWTVEQTREAVRDACDAAAGKQRPGPKPGAKKSPWSKVLDEPVEGKMESGVLEFHVDGYVVKVKPLKTKGTMWKEQTSDE